MLELTLPLVSEWSEDREESLLGDVISRPGVGEVRGRLETEPEGDVVGPDLEYAVVFVA